MSDQNQSSKDHLRGAYKAFLLSEAGKDFIKQSEMYERAFVLQGIKAKTSDEKAHAICKVEGLVQLRDYIVRMSRA